MVRQGYKVQSKWGPKRQTEVHLISPSSVMLPNSLRFRAMYELWSSLPPAYATPRNPDQPAMISCSLVIDKEGSPGTASRGSSSPPSAMSDMLTSISSAWPRPSMFSPGSKFERWFIARRVAFPLALCLADCFLDGVGVVGVVATAVLPYRVPLGRPLFMEPPRSKHRGVERVVGKAPAAPGGAGIHAVVAMVASGAIATVVAAPP